MIKKTQVQINVTRFLFSLHDQISMVVWIYPGKWNLCILTRQIFIRTSCHQACESFSSERHPNDEKVVERKEQSVGKSICVINWVIFFNFLDLEMTSKVVTTFRIFRITTTTCQRSWRVKCMRHWRINRRKMEQLWTTASKQVWIIQDILLLWLSEL